MPQPNPPTAPPLARWASFWAAARLGALALAATLAGCASAPPTASSALPPGWQLSPRPGGASGPVLDLWRPARAGPARWRLVLLPGSGCSGWAPIAERYTAALLHADIHLLHKPGADPQAGPQPEHCPPGFDDGDTLARWAEAARAAVAGLATTTPATAPPGPPLPTWLVGVSEGGELLSAVAPAVPALAGLVLLGSPGLDPADAARLQARRLGAEPAWERVQQAAASGLPDGWRTQGRPLRYWRVLLNWPVAEPLWALPVPLWQVWGSADAAQAPEAYAAGARRAQGRPAGFCAWPVPGHDHGLQHPASGADGLQALWRRLEAGQRPGATLRCPGLSPLDEPADEPGAAPGPGHPPAPAAGPTHRPAAGATAPPARE